MRFRLLSNIQHNRVRFERGELIQVVMEGEPAHAVMVREDGSRTTIITEQQFHDWHSRDLVELLPLDTPREEAGDDSAVREGRAAGEPIVPVAPVPSADAPTNTSPLTGEASGTSTAAAPAAAVEAAVNAEPKPATDDAASSPSGATDDEVLEAVAAGKAKRKKADGP